MNIENNLINKEVILLNDILPVSTNITIIKELCNHHWFISHDKTNDRFEKIFSNKNNGFSIVTVERNEEKIQTVLNTYGKIICDIIVEKLKMNLKIDRLFWNMYLKNAESEIHIDTLDPECISIVYNLHTTDGGTEINGKFYEDKIGQAKIFNSNIPHRGVAIRKDNVRFNLNIILKSL
jgi:hypothetical protein